MNVYDVLNGDADTTCTSLLVDKHFGGQFHNWAITAAFGDNLNAVAEDLAKVARLSADQAESLKALGVCINSNMAQASRLLGITRPTLYNLTDKYRINTTADATES